MKQVAVGIDKVWGIGTNDHLFSRPGVDGLWFEEQADVFTSLDVGLDGRVWVVKN